MIRTAIAWSLAGAALAPLPAAAQTAAAPAVSPARQALAMTLAKLLNPAEPSMVAADRVLSEQLPTAMRADPTMKAMEERYPGLLAAMVEAMKPILLRNLRDTLPALWQQMADLFASELSEADLRAAVGFYSSPTGQRVIELMMTNVDAGPMIKDMTSNGYVATQENLNASVQSSAQHAVTQLTPAQLNETAAFARTPAGRRVVALRPRMMKLIADFSNAPAPGVEAEIQAVLVPVVERFTGMKLNP